MLLVNRSALIRILLITILIFSIFFLRSFLIFIYPIFTLTFIYLFELKFRIEHILYFFLLLLITLISSLLDGFFIENYIFSIYLLIPHLLLITSIVDYKKESKTKTDYFGYFFSYLSKFLVVVNISAFIYSQYLISESQNFEDSFTGLYGSGGFGSHTLSIINLMVCIYYFYFKKLMVNGYL